MKKTSKLAAILTALALALALTACSHPNSGDDSSGSSSEGSTPVIQGTYSGELTDSEGGDPFDFAITVDSTGKASFSWTSVRFSGPVTLNGDSFSIAGSKAGNRCTITGTVSADGLTLGNITIDGTSYTGTLTLEGELTR